MAIELLRSLPREYGDENGLIFLGTRRNQPMASQVMGKVLHQHDANATIHGFRSSWRDWASEVQNADYEAIEKSLAHAVGGSVERAYSRSPLIERRRQLMEAWAAFLVSK